MWELRRTRCLHTKKKARGVVLPKFQTVFLTVFSTERGASNGKR